MNRSKKIKELVGLGVLGALVAGLQMIKIPLGQFSITLSLVPVVVGAILYGPKGGAFLGFIMGVVVLFVDAAMFYAINPIGTIITVLLKSSVAGLISSYVYILLKNKEKFGIIVSCILCPIINTLIFVLGCLVFFYPYLQELAGDRSVLMFILIYYIGLNFIVEFAISAVMSPTVIYLVKEIAKKFNLA